MTESEWLAKTREHSQAIRSLIDSYHPANRDVRSNPQMKITAPLAEQYTEEIRKEIAAEYNDGKAPAKSPIVAFDKALATEDSGALLRLMEQAWLGVPESTDCWRLEGFSEIVDLLDDPPTQEETTIAVESVSFDPVLDDMLDETAE